MTRDEALTVYNTGPEVVAKILCDFSDTIQLQQEQIKDLEIKIAKLSKNSSNSSKPPSSDDITKAKKGEKAKRARKAGNRVIPGMSGPCFPKKPSTFSTATNWMGVLIAAARSCL